MSIKKTTLELIAPVFVANTDIVKSTPVDVSAGLTLAILLWMAKTTITADGSDTLFAVEVSSSDTGDTHWTQIGGELFKNSSMTDRVLNGNLALGSTTMPETVSQASTNFDPGFFIALIGADAAHSEFVRISGTVSVGPANPAIRFRNPTQFDHLNGQRISCSPCALAFFQTYQVVGYKRARVVFINKGYAAKQPFFIRCQGLLVEGN